MFRALHRFSLQRQIKALRPAQGKPPECLGHKLLAQNARAMG